MCISQNLQRNITNIHRYVEDLYRYKDISLHIHKEIYYKELAYMIMEC